jgi:hypothetical protein
MSQTASPLTRVRRAPCGVLLHGWAQDTHSHTQTLTPADLRRVLGLGGAPLSLVAELRAANGYAFKKRRARNLGAGPCRAQPGSGVCWRTCFESAKALSMFETTTSLGLMVACNHLCLLFGAGRAAREKKPHHRVCAACGLKPFG